MFTQSWLKSSATVRHLKRRPVAHVEEVRAQHVVVAPVATPPACIRDLDDRAAELLRHGIAIAPLRVEEQVCLPRPLKALQQCQSTDERQ